jgi:hypothetical protein
MTIAARPLVVLTGLGVLVGFLIGGLAALALVERAGQRFAFLYDDFSIGGCLKALEGDGLRATDAAERRQQIDLCYNRLVRQGQINEFQIRRVSFENQHVADLVIMWMVVCLTLSGVALAAIQIVASLDMFGGKGSPDSEFSVEKGRIFLRSSITGLFILLISFGFFYTYIIFVYRIVEVGPAVRAEQSPGVPPGLPRLEGVAGGLGPPPAAGGQP